MARKNLLKDLMTEAAQGEPPPSPAPRRTKGAIGAVSQSIADLKSRALIEVPADMIDNAGLTDRLDADDDMDSLVESIREYGQQVPVLLRFSPNVEGRYDVVYGRRRVAALKKLRLPVRAMLRDLNDRDLIVAQGQENSARKDLSFIEKANFARQMVEMGFDRKVVCDALHIDKTVISRMLSVIDAVPDKVVRAIGSAPSAGRDRWLALAGRMGNAAAGDVVALAQGATSDERFAAVFEALAPRRPPKTGAEPLRGSGGQGLGQVSRGKKRTTLTLDRKDGFDDWLLRNMDRIHREFLKEGGE